VSQYNETIEEKVDRQVMESLRAITDGNYPFTATVRWKNRQGHEIEPTKLALIPGNTTLDESVGSWGFDYYRKQYTVFAPVFAAENDSESDGEKGSNYAGAITRAVMLDPQLSALAINTTIQGIDREDDGVSVNFEVLFRTLKDDPFNEE
jgi:hypothetical protein